jgi:hypothetical protein
MDANRNLLSAAITLWCLALDLPWYDPSVGELQRSWPCSSSSSSRRQHLRHWHQQPQQARLTVTIAEAHYVVTRLARHLDAVLPLELLLPLCCWASLTLLLLLHGSIDGHTVGSHLVDSSFADCPLTLQLLLCGCCCGCLCGCFCSCSQERPRHIQTTVAR